MNLNENIENAIRMAVRFGGTDGGHHKAWVIDQMVRALCGCKSGENEYIDMYSTNEKYEEVVRKAKSGIDGPNTYDWDEGIAP